MRLRFKRPPDLMLMPGKIEREIRTFLSFRLETALTEFNRIILENTPVYTGRTLVNYRWSVGAAEKGRRSAIKDPQRPGVTSDMALGQEPRRDANAAVVQNEFNGMIRSTLGAKNPFQKFFLSNNVEHFTDVEYGTYSEDARTPAGGMTRAGEVVLRSVVRGIRKVG